MDTERAVRLVRQHAGTSALLGVPFVPVYRTTGDDEPTSPPASPAPARPIGATVEPKAVASVHLKPVPTRPRPAERRVAPGARDRAASQSLLDALRERYEREAPHQHFVTDHTKIVFGEGDAAARLMFVGEAPGADEDRTGRPFVGRAGQLLEKMIAAMGLRREEVYIANVLKTRPPNNATPTFDEIKLCAPYLFEQIGIIGPAVLVTLGLPAARALLGTNDSMGRLRGHWAEFIPPRPYEQQIAVMPTYHPAFLLRSYTPDNRAKVWSDLKLVMERLGLATRSVGPGNPGSPASGAKKDV